MNEEHALLCNSPEWAAHLGSEILAPLVDGTRVGLGTRMLELGPGPGAATGWLRHKVGHLTAVELDPLAAEQLAARYSGTNVSVETGDCSSLSFPDESFDSVGSFTMLHHVPTRTGQAQVLGEAFRVLRRGGVLIGSDSLASDGLHRFHAGDTYNPVEPVWLFVVLQILGFSAVTVSAESCLTFTARKPAGDPGRQEEGKS